MNEEFTLSMPLEEIVSIRTVNAPATIVFRAWSEENHLKNWWGPAGFTNTFEEFDFKEGGRWKFMMHGPDKGNYPNEVIFTKIISPVLIEWKRISQPLFNVIFTFEQISDSKTKIIFRMIFATEEECNKIKRFALEKNEENFDKLEVELSKMN